MTAPLVRGRKEFGCGGPQWKLFGIILLVLTFVCVELAAIGVGAAHVHQCKVEEKIPVFLVVSGALCLLGGVTSVRRSRGERIDTCCCSYTCDRYNIPVVLLIVGWFITGNVWVYSVYPSVNTVDTGNLSYCQPTLYFFAFCYVTIKWIMAVLAAMALPFVMTSFSLPFTVQSPGGRHGYSPF
ncbi:transmembrane protein 272-like [Branchiostoma floridae]|uniref:Transmembrane protein 272-like n=1 Tax=Branchiostoma floridae TaxID=7739 RepID=A0A9J7M3Q9_BRAFL|nr:transmembrane protein 272-like [Branchiostoma floridae]